MTTYGPWQDGRVHEEIIHAKVTADTDPPVVYELLSPSPTRRSGFSIASLPGTSVTAGITWDWPGGLDDPPPPDPARSQAAFIAAMLNPVGAQGGEYQFQIYSDGGRFPSQVGHWTASHGWTMRLTEYRMGYTYLNDMSALYAIPEGMDNITDEYYVELEPWTLGESARIELVSATVLGPGDAGDWGLFAKDVGEEQEFLTTLPQGVEPSQGNIAPFDFTVDGLQDVMDYVQDNDGDLPGDEVDAFALPTVLPRMAWLYKGTYLSDAHFDGSQFVLGTDGNPVDVKITYKMPRWRQVFYEDPTVPYRRIYPRDDSLGAGSNRNWPRKASQSGNRTSGTYL